jgi:beta-glucosidase
MPTGGGSACLGNPFQPCGGAFRVLAYQFNCTTYNPPANQPWLDPSQPTAARVSNLVDLLASSPSYPTSLIAQLVQNGADIYAPNVQLPRYLVSQECLAGYDSGQIYIAPPIVSLNSSSAFPQPAALGCTFDPALVREIASAISDEARAGWRHFDRPSLTCMSPVLNVVRHPGWGRAYESYGEEPSVIGALGSAYIRGLQEGTPGQGGGTSVLKIFAVPKHLGAYSVECYNASGGANDYPSCPVYRSFFNAVLGNDEMREFYLPGWEQVFALPKTSGSPAAPAPSGVMCSYNAVNGVPMVSF